MNTAEMRRLVAGGESHCVEFKKSTADLTGACESLCAFLNSNQEGYVLIGVSGGKLVGQEVTDRTQQEIAHCLKEIEPRIKIEWGIIPIDGLKKVIFFKTNPNWNLTPFSYKGRPFWRSGTTTSIMERDHYIELMREQIEKTHPFEASIAQDYSLDNIDLDKLNHVVEVGIQLGRLPSGERSRPKKLLEKFQLMAAGKLKKAAVILFGKDFTHMLQCCVQMARFKGTEKGEFLDSKRLTGHAFDIFDQGMIFMQRHIPLWAKIESDSPFRKEDYLIPLDAFREALVNAICHRDYSDYSGNLFIAIYDDRMEIENIGSLHRDLKVEDLKKSHASKPRNKLLADMFYYYGLIEQWGQGTQKMIQLCKKAGLAEPEFQIKSHWFKVIFKAEIKASPPFKNISLSPRQEGLYRLIGELQKARFKEIQERYPNVPRRTLQDDLLFLKRNKYLITQGQRRAAFWFLNPRSVQD